MPLSVFKALVREQFNMLLTDTDAALAAIPSMLPPDVETRREAFGLIRRALGAIGEFSVEDNKRLGAVARLFGVDAGSAAAPNLAIVPSSQTQPQAKAS